MSYHFLIDQVLCAKAYLLLKNGLREVYGITDNPAFEYVRHEKPVLRDYPDIHFNLSHCKRGILCVIDDEPIGCDIEEIETVLDIDLCHVCYNDSEEAEIISAPEPCVAFTKLWTMKEAVLKLSGHGLTDNLKVVMEDFTGKLKTVDYSEKNYVYSIATE